MGNQKQKVKVTINGKQQKHNSSHNGQHHYGDAVNIAKQDVSYLIWNPLAVNYVYHQETHSK